MDLQAFKAFACIAELGSFSRAADILNQTQPTISRQISSLEEAVGGKLFTRHRQGVSLTDAGSIFLAHVTRVLRSVEQAKAEIAARREQPSGNIAVAFPPSLLEQLSGPVIARCAQQYPDVALEVREALANELEQLLVSQKVDVAVLLTDQRQISGVDLEPLFHESIVLAGRDNAGPLRSKALAVGDLKNLPIIFCRYPNFVTYLVHSACRASGFRPTQAVLVDSLTMAVKLAELGLGYCVLPACAAHAARDRLSYSVINGLRLTWTLGVSRDHADRPAVTALAALIRARAQEITTATRSRRSVPVLAPK